MLADLLLHASDLAGQPTSISHAFQIGLGSKLERFDLRRLPLQCLLPFERLLQGSLSLLQHLDVVTLLFLFDYKLIFLLSDLLASRQLKLDVVASVGLSSFDEKLKVIYFALQIVESRCDFRSNATIPYEFARV